MEIKSKFLKHLALLLFLFLPLSVFSITPEIYEILKAEDQRQHKNPVLINALKSQKIPVVIQALRSLGRIGDSDKTSLIAEFLNHDNSQVRIEASQSLGFITLQGQ